MKQINCYDSSGHLFLLLELQCGRLSQSSQKVTWDFYFFLLYLPSRTTGLKFLQYYLRFRGEIQSTSTNVHSILNIGSSLKWCLRVSFMLFYKWNYLCSLLPHTCEPCGGFEGEGESSLLCWFIFSLRQPLSPWVTGVGHSQLSNPVPHCSSGPSIFACFSTLVGLNFFFYSVSLDAIDFHLCSKSKRFCYLSQSVSELYFVEEIGRRIRTVLHAFPRVAETPDFRAGFFIGLSSCPNLTKRILRRQTNNNNKTQTLKHKLRINWWYPGRTWGPVVSEIEKGD